MEVRFFLDEDVQVLLVQALRARGVDAVHVYELDRGGEEDAPQLAFAASDGRCLVTYNKRDYAVLWAEWMEIGREHHGIVVAKRSPPGHVLAELMRIASGFSAEGLKNQILHIGRGSRPPIVGIRREPAGRRGPARLLGRASLAGRGTGGEAPS